MPVASLVRGHRGVRAGEEKGLVPAVLPAHEIRGTIITSVHLDYLTVAVVFTNAVALDDDAITCLGMHAVLPS